MTAVSLLLIAILIISLWQLYFLIKIRKKISGNNPVNDSRYFELKYQIESYVKVFAILIAIAAYFGYDTFSKSKEDIEKAYVEPLDKYKARLDSINVTTKAFEEFITRFNIEKEAIKSVLLKTGNDAKGIERDINLLAANRINQMKIHVVYLKVPGAPDKPAGTSRKIFHFKDLKTYNGKILPKFKSPPFVQIQDNDYVSSQIVHNVTSESFEADVYEEDANFYIWILSED